MLDDMSCSEADLRYGLCRCCLKKGFHKDMCQEQRFDGTREVYLDMVKDTFDIVIDFDGSSTLICNPCISTLRDSSRFKAMVVCSQECYRDAIEDRSTEFINVEEDPISFKTEVIKLEEEDRDNDSNTEFLYDYNNDSMDNEPLPLHRDSSDDDSVIEKYTLREKEFLKRFENVQLKPLPKKSTLPRAPPITFRMKLNLLKGKIITTKSLQQITNVECIEDIANSQVTEKNAHIQNTSTILQYSNVTPFKSKSFHGFPCFYCRHTFKAPNELREHVKNAHTNVDVRSILWKYGAESLVVYVDVTDLVCKLCHANMKNLNELKKHLTNAHKKEMCLEYTDRIVPFKLSDENIYECQVCGFSFETFGAIERHMNTHYRNYVCKECGGGFVTKYRLKTHIKNMHLKGAHQCKECKKEYATQQKLKNHVDTVHKLTKRFKCPHCKERFTEYFTRQKHLVQVHGAAPLHYKCNVCDRVFDRRYTLSRHLKKDHLEERDYQCDVCPYRCFTKTELQVHMIKHVGERIYECKVCKKAYARKKTLKEHMRIHNNDRRFTCTVCGQAFIQKCSLKGHIKTHHPELNGLQ